MKKIIPFILFLICILISCNDASEKENIKSPNTEVGDAEIIFDNTNGICEVTVYSSYTRSEDSIIKIIPAGKISSEINWVSGDSISFFFSYLVTVKDINGFSINYVPSQVQLNQVAVRVDPNKTTTVIIPKIEETISSDSLLSNKSYLLIQNNSSFSFSLVRGSIVLQPDNISSTTVNARERAQYTVDAGTVSNYNLNVSGTYIPLSSVFDGFEPGFVYSLIVEGTSIHKILEREVKLGNVADASGNDALLDAPSAPNVIAGDGNLLVTWMPVTGAQRYEVYIDTKQSPPAEPVRTVQATTVYLDGLTNKTSYFVWIKAVNNFGSSDHSFRTRGIPWPLGEAPAAPGIPIIIPGMHRINVIWEACGGAESYEVFVREFFAERPSEPEVTTDKTNAVIDNLENNVIYMIQVRAVNRSGKSDFSPEEAGTPTIPTVLPDIPSRPVLAAGNREINVSWQNTFLAQTYEVWYGTSSNSAQAVKFPEDITETEIVITGLTNETLYYVWIKAKNNIGTTSFSPSASARPSVFAVIPDIPQIQIVNGSKEFTVNWDRIDGAHTYEIYINTADNPETAEKYGEDYETTSVLVKGLENGTVYYVWVRAKNDIGVSGFSLMAFEEPSVYNAAPPAPAAPRLTSGTKQIAVSWNEVEGALLYEVWYGTSDNTSSAQKYGEDTRNNSAVISNLTNGTTYYVRIKAKNDSGTSGFSPSASDTPSDFNVPPAAPSAPSVEIGSAQIEISWNPVAGAITYEVWKNTSDDSETAEKYTDITGALTAKITELVNGTTYYIWLKAKNNAGTSSFSLSVTGKPIANALLPSLVARNSQIDVSWTAIAGAEQYEIFYGLSVNPPQTAFQTIGAPSTSITIPGLTNGTTYNVWIRGKNSTGTGLISAVTSAKPIGDMGAVTAVTGGVSGQLVLSWVSVAGADEYEVYHHTVNSMPSKFSYKTFNTIYTISNLDNGTQYYVWVKPVNEKGAGTVSLTGGTPLAAPANLTISVANHEVTLSWQSVLGAGSYNIYQSTSSTIPNSATYSSTATSRQISGLTNGTTYYFWVRAVNANGTGPESAGVNGMPIALPGSLTLTAGNGQITISWEAIAGAVNYNVYHSATTAIPGTPTTQNITGTGTSRTISGLTNGTMYNFWVRPVNSGGTAGNASPMASGKPIGNMGAVTVTTGNASGQLTLNWDAVGGADNYDIYRNTDNSMPESPLQSVSTNTAVISALTNGTTYYFWVRPRNSHGTGAISSVKSGTPLGTPTGLSASAADQQVTLNWTAATGASSYEIYYSTTTSIPPAPNVTGITGTSGTVTGLDNGTTYNFWVRARNATGSGGASTMVCGKPIGNMGTVTPTTGGESSQLVLNWSAVIGADQYEIYRSTTDTIPSAVTQTVNTTHVTMIGLTNGTTYYFWVKPINNAYGVGGTSTVVSAMPIAAPAVTLSAANQQVTLNWSSVTGASSYDIYQSTSTTIPSTASYTGITGTSRTITGLTNGTTYNFWVRARNATGLSGASSMVSGKPIGSMGTVTVTTGGASGQIVLNWSEVAGAEQYEVYRSTGDSMPANPTQTVNTTTVTMTGLTNGTTYNFWVKPINPSGVGGTSSAVSGTPIAAPAVTLSAANQQITLSWSSVTGAASYEIYQSTSTTIPSTASYTGITGTSRTITGLTNGTTYNFWVRAVSAAGSGSASSIVSATPIENMGEVRVYGQGSDRLAISWDSVAGATHYEVFQSTTSVMPETPVTSTLTNTSRNFTGLTSGIRYYFWVIPTNANGKGMVSSVVSGIPVATPAAPALIGGLNQLHVSWEPVAGADRYAVRFGTDQSTITLFTNTSETSTTITGLINGTTYYVNIVASNDTTVSSIGPSASAQAGLNPGLYRNNERIGSQNLAESAAYISGNAQNGDDFFIVLGTNESSSTQINFSRSNTTASVVLLGSGSERTITLNSAIINVNTGFTLIIYENITITGSSASFNALVVVNTGAFLVMNDKSKIIGNTAYNGNGINNSGNFTMNGGIVSGNNYDGINNSGNFTMNGGTVSGNTRFGINNSGSFTMNGGTVSDNTSDGVYVLGGTTVMNGGIISGNIQHGVNVGSGTFTITGGTIRRNAQRGIVVVSGTAVMEGGIISGNDDCGVYVIGSFIKNQGGIIYGSDASGNDADGFRLSNTNYAVNGLVNSINTRRITTAGTTDLINTTTGQGVSTTGNPPYGP